MRDCHGKYGIGGKPGTTLLTVIWVLASWCHKYHLHFSTTHSSIHNDLRFCFHTLDNKIAMPWLDLVNL